MSHVNFVVAATALNYAAGFEAVANPIDYATLAWIGTPIPKATLDAAYLELMRSQKVAELTRAMGTEAAEGFPSDALTHGVEVKYDSDVQGQIAVVGAVVYVRNVLNADPAASYVMSYVDLITGQRTFAPHSFDQLKKLLTDLGAFSAEMLTRLQAQIEQVLAIHTGNVDADLDAIAAIEWQHH